MADDDVPAVGIDLGTTFSCVAIFKNGRPKVLSNENGNRITPSYVTFTSNGYLVGEEARYVMATRPTDVIYQVKRLMGRPFDDPHVQEDIKNWPFDVREENGKPMLVVTKGGEQVLVSPEEISSKILLKMKSIAENHLDQKVSKAVITVPAYFNDSQRQATKVAAELAGLEVLRMVNEPTAAAIAYGYKKKMASAKTILIFDLGGGTFDVSVINVEDDILQVMATGGDTHLGGSDFDNRMVQKTIQYFNDEFNPAVKVPNDVRSTFRHRLTRAVEYAKCQLSSDEKATINVDDFYENKDFLYDMYRDQFNEANQDLFHKTIDHVEKVLQDANLTAKQIDEVILVGGSTRIPLVKRLLSDFFYGKKLNTSINPDEAVACGAVIEAAILLGKPGVDDLLLMDVTPLTLGIQVKGGIMLNIIPRNTLIPANGHEGVTTVTDNQTAINFKVYQGERPIAKENHYLGEFLLEGVEDATAGVPSIDVRFDLDVNGILRVTAQDKVTRARKSISIEHNKARMSDEDIARILQEAETYKMEDTKERDRILARNQLESTVRWLLYLFNNKLKEIKITQAYRNELVEKCNEVEEWLKNNEHATTDECKWKYGILEDMMCKDIPPDYRNPGRLPDGTRLHEYDGFAPSINRKPFGKDDDDNDGDEEIFEID